MLLQLVVVVGKLALRVEKCRDCGPRLIRSGHIVHHWRLDDDCGRVRARLLEKLVRLVMERNGVGIDVMKCLLSTVCEARGTNRRSLSDAMLLGLNGEDGLISCSRQLFQRCGELYCPSSSPSCATGCGDSTD